jgi:hypothetical protein
MGFRDAAMIRHDSTGIRGGRVRFKSAGREEVSLLSLVKYDTV